jgi:hypothetical protein
MERLDGPILLSHDEVFFGASIATNALEVFRQMGCVVLGFEGVTTDGKSIRPNLDYICDLSTIRGSWAERVDRSVQRAAEVLAEWGDGAQFIVFVLQDDASG